MLPNLTLPIVNSLAPAIQHSFTGFSLPIYYLLKLYNQRCYRGRNLVDNANEDFLFSPRRFSFSTKTRQRGSSKSIPSPRPAGAHRCRRGNGVAAGTSPSPSCPSAETSTFCTSIRREVPSFRWETWPFYRSSSKVGC